MASRRRRQQQQQSISIDNIIAWRITAWIFVILIVVLVITSYM